MKRDGQEVMGKIRKIADYQLGRGVGEALFPDNVKVVFSRRTGRIRHVYLKGKLLVTLRPTDGMFSLTVEGGRRLFQKLDPPRLWVRVSSDAAPFVAEGRSVFAKHVIAADSEIRSQEEVVIVGKGDTVLGVGKAVLTGKEMTEFKRGVAVKVRRGAEESHE